MTTLAPEFKGGIWVTRGRSHPGLADRPPRPTKPPDNLFLQSRIYVILEEEEEKESPSFGRCRPLSRVADSGPKAKVNHHLISPLPSLRLYPCMCGLNPEPDLRPDLSPVNPSSTPGALTSRGRPNKGPADGYLLPEPREQPHQLGLAEVLPGRVRNLPGPRSSSESQPSA